MGSYVEPEDLLLSANILLCSLLNNWNPQYGLGSIENSVYHTAWISMVLKNDEWAFPECFEFLVNTQREDGSWGNTASGVDQVCNGLVSLLAIKRHLRGPVSYSETTRADLQKRSDRAVQFIRATLSNWNIQSYNETLPIGFELWFPVILQLLEKEGLTFEVPGIDRIQEIRATKLSKFSIEDLYAEKPLSALYSLEAFIGIADFSRLSHHKRLGCIHYSASATAVYLMEAPDWDEEAEAFLRHIVQLSVAHGRGVPETFPTSFFESSWILSTLLQHGFSKDELDQNVLGQLQDRLVHHFEDQNGLVGAAESVPPDPDDTAKMLTALHLLGQSHSPDNMIQRWEGPDHFVVFTGERNASPTANANVLLALVHLSRNGEYSRSVEKCVRFLCGSWWETDGLLYDKWNTSAYYPVMLISEAFCLYLSACEKGLVEALPDDLLRVQLPLVLVQALVRTLQTQNPNGSWGTPDSTEETAYAILAITNVTSLLPPIQNLLWSCARAVERGRVFIKSHPIEPEYSNHIWVGKITFGLPTIARGYILGALKCRPNFSHGPLVRNVFPYAVDEMAKYTKVHNRISLFSESPAWVTEASFLESLLLIRKFSEVDLLEQKRSMSDSPLKHLCLILTGIVNSKLLFLELSTHVLYDTLEFMLITYLIDHYGDTQLRWQSIEVVKSCENLIYEGFPEINIGSPRRVTTGEPQSNSVRDTNDEATISQLRIAISTHKKSVMGLPGICTASEYRRQDLLFEMRRTWLSIVSDAELSITAYGLCPSSQNGSGGDAGYGFYHWLQTSGVDSVFYGYVMAFMICRVSDGHDVFPTSLEKYLVQDWCRHKAIEYRLYNEVGSMGRDQAESNVNAADFVEFRGSTLDKAKTDLLAMAKLEGEVAKICWERLQASGLPNRPRRVNAVLHLLNWITDANSELYVMRNVFAPHV